MGNKSDMKTIKAVRDTAGAIIFLMFLICKYGNQKEMQKIIDKVSNNTDELIKEAQEELKKAGLNK